MPAAKKTTTRKAKADNQKVLDAVSNLSAETVIDQIGELQVNLQATLAGLGAAVTSKVEQMKAVDEAIALKESELQDVYGIEQEAMSLEEMKLQRDNESKEWETEKTARQIQWDEEDEERNKRWQREEEEHAYMVAQRNDRTNQEHRSLVEKNQRAEKIRQEELVRSWTERENVLKTQESEVAALKEQVAGFEDRLKTEVRKAEAIAESRLKKQHEHELALMEKDINAERNLHATKVSALDDTIETLTERIASLQRDLDSARKDAKEVTTAALQSASGRDAQAALLKSMDHTSSGSKK